MDRIKIGKFIAKCRKDKSITQEQLAEMLNITNKSVSKWKNGTCLPDPSLYEPLCNILEVFYCSVILLNIIPILLILFREDGILYDKLEE